MITTIQRIQFSIVRNININSIATAIGKTPAIINASVPFYLHNSWILTLGGNYRFNPNWVIRVAGSFLQSPDTGHYQISTGNSYILGASLGYKINKILTLDGGYAHAFIQNQNININGNRFLINGNNQGSRDVVSLKLTINV
jgi:long-subunit fatty acid transport protein